MYSTVNKMLKKETHYHISIEINVVKPVEALVTVHQSKLSHIVSRIRIMTLNPYFRYASVPRQLNLQYRYQKVIITVCVCVHSSAN